MNIKYNKSSVIARGGLTTALGVLCVYLSSYLPTNKIFVLALGSCLILISILTLGIKNSLLVFFSTALLSILISGIKLTSLAYLLFFGSYGFVKYYIERLNKIVLEYVLKLLFCNLCLFILLYIYKVFFPALFSFTTSIYIIIMIAQIAFLVYDYALTVFISYFRKRFIKLK